MTPTKPLMEDYSVLSFRDEQLRRRRLVISQEEIEQKCIEIIEFKFLMKDKLNQSFLSSCWKLFDNPIVFTRVVSTLSHLFI